MSETPRIDIGDDNTGQTGAVDLAVFMSDFEKQMAALRAQTEPFRNLIDAVSVRIESGGHEVAVTVTISGALVDVEFLPAAAAVAPVDLAVLILATYERAATAARERAHDLVEGFVDENARVRNHALRLMEQALAEQAQRHDRES